MKTSTAREAAGRIPDGATLLIGGFMGVGSPERVIGELVRQGRRELTVRLVETAPGVSVEQVLAATEARLDVAPEVRAKAVA